MRGYRTVAARMRVWMLCMRDYRRTGRWGERTRYPRCAKQRRAQHRIGKAAAETQKFHRLTSHTDSKADVNDLSTEWTGTCIGI